jgi:hypothetical protein
MAFGRQERRRAMTRLAMSFEGCRTWTELEPRLRIFLEQVAIDNAVTFPDEKSRDSTLRHNYAGIDSMIAQARLAWDGMRASSE